MKRNYLLLFFAVLSIGSYAQLTIQTGATFFIQPGATVTVQGDVNSLANIQGTGLLLLKGTSAQNVNMNGFTVEANVEIDNTNHVMLTGAARTAGLLTFTNGKIILGGSNLIMATTATFAGAGTGKFVETNGAGQLRREIAANGNLVLPIGTGTRYTPLEFQVAGATFAAAYVAGRAINGGHPNKHPRSSDFLNQYWSLARSGVTGGTVTTVGSYTDGTDVTGVEADIRTLTWNGSAWSLGTGQNNAANTVTAAFAGATGDLYAMNRFVLTNPTAFLQGTFNTGTNLMNDLLRNSGAYSPGVLPASNLLPTSDPYRTATYNTSFVHVANPVTETIASSVLNDQAVAAENIVDWVFLELRNTTVPGNTILQTRSALVRRNGVIVDVDGVSPIYFKNIDAGSYVVIVRHRNHIGMGVDPTTPLALGLASSSFNFTTAADANLLGTAGSAYTIINGFNMLWAGNANSNVTSRYQGAANDRAVILADLSSNELTILNNVYHKSDLNMNRVVRYQGAANDRSFLLSNVLASGELTIRTQVLPN